LVRSFTSISIATARFSSGFVREDELVNTLKPLLICAVLAGIGYGVYVRINSGADVPPPGAPQDWSVPPQVQLSDAGEPGAPPAWPGNAGAAAGAAPPFASSPSAAPPTGPAGAEAPPFAPPTTPPAAAPVSVGTTAPPLEPSVGVPPVGPGTASAPAADPLAAPPANDPAAQAAPGAAAADPPAPAPGPDRYGTPPAGSADRYATPAAPPAATAAPYPAPDATGAAPAAAGAASAPTASAPGATAPAAPPADRSFADLMETARRELEAGQMAEALEQLSSWYDDPRLSPAERQQLNQTLDQVAGTVVYSTQHLLEPPYEVQSGEKLEDIGQRYNVPWKLLAKINGIEDPGGLRAGERLKVVRGPFNAVISLDKRELTLQLANGSYAGRFPIGIGNEPPPREGTYTVSDKVVNPVYHGRATAAGAGDEGNPLGNRWIGLGSDLGIHGTNRPENIGRTDLPGSISLGPRDIEDVFDILATGSKVTIRR
jgi:LysM repeat protein